MLDYVYCVACNAGSEAALKRDLTSQFPDATILYPMFDREEKKLGKWVTKTYPLIPGYLFVYSDTPIPPAEFFHAERVNRLLGYTGVADEDGVGTAQHSYQLAGSDLQFATWVFENGGHIKVSQAALIGGKVQIVKGPLKYYEGVIKKMDKHKRSALVTVTIGDSYKDVWMAFEWVKTDVVITE